MSESDELARLERIFHPYATEQMEAFIKGQPDGKVSFVHYTSAKAALGIIESKRVWMRNITGMCDYSEVLYGRSLLQEVLFQDDRKNLQALTEAVDACAEGAAYEALRSFDQMWNDIRTNTYVACVSEHCKEEDEHGRLSMWRAFGGTDIPVALVFKFPPSVLNLGVFNLVVSPVAYFGKEHVQAELRRVVNGINDSREYLKKLGREQLTRSLHNMLVAAVTCIKHGGFKEEREWRLIYGPIRWPSLLIEQERETKEVGGIPQIIYKIPLDANIASAPEAIKELDFAHLFDRLIVGPATYPYSMLGAFAIALRKAGIPEPQIVSSGIPIRL
jgi:hypothetical protein